MNKERVLSESELNTVKTTFNDLANFLIAHNEWRIVSFYGDSKYLYLKSENFVVIYSRKTYEVIEERYRELKFLDTVLLSKVLVQTMYNIGRYIPWSINTVYFNSVVYDKGILRVNPEVRGYMDLVLGE